MATNGSSSARVLAAVHSYLDRTGLTVNVLSSLSQLPEASLEHKLNGDGEFTVGELFSIAQALGISPSDLAPPETNDDDV